MLTFVPMDQLRERRSSKWTSYSPDVLPMFVAETDVEIAEPIKRVLQRALDLGDTGYPQDRRHLAAAFTGFAQRRWGWTLDNDQVLPTADVAVGTMELLSRLLPAGSKVIINTPVYYPFFFWPPQSGMELVEVPMLAATRDDGSPTWALDLPAMEQAFADGATGYLLCHPHNPLGHINPTAELAAIADLAEKYGVTVFSDEIHAPLVMPGETFTSYLAVSDAARRTGVALHAASKAWNLAGLKAAVIVTDDEGMAQRLRAVPDDFCRHTGHWGDLAAEAAYREGDAWLDEFVDLVDANHRLLAELLAQHLPAATVVPARATYLAWVDVSALGWGDHPAAALVKHGRVAFNEGTTFGALGAGHVRVNLGCHPDTVREAVRRMVAADEAIRAL